MKPLIIAFTLLASVLTTTSYATDNTIAPAALQSFKTNFIYASEVKWSNSNGLYKAAFEMSGVYANAFYNEVGDLVALTRHLSLPQLPISLQVAFKKEYKDYWISDLIEVTNEGGTQYYLTAETADAKIILQSIGSNWTTFKKSRKA